jgi:saccharopine dehydrogenase-like NADP-dependent oxidoreductase
MSTTPRPIVLLGAGKIGFAIALMLERSGDYAVLVADQDPARLGVLAELGCETRQISDDESVARCIEGAYAVVNALPFHRATAVAGLCAKAGVHYFDLTEDVASTHAIQALAQDVRSVLMPQCGLAPGFIGIVGNALARRFDTLLDLRMRVGALPRYPSNSLRYNLTWSTEGLINEYCNPCEAIVDGQLTSVPALEGYETFALDGVEYEAYKSVRYPGHCNIMKLLLNDLRLRDRRDLLKDIFESAIPTTEQDVIVIQASASGHRHGRLEEESYPIRVFGADVDGHRLSAIQLSTAAGICAALDLVAQGVLPQQGFVGQEAIDLDALLNNRFGRVYAGKPLALAGCATADR